MSFEKMNKADLLEAAEALDVQVDEKDTKAEIIEEIDLSGYSYDDYAELTGLDSEDDEEVLAEPAVVEEEEPVAVEETVVEEEPASEEPAPDADGKLLLFFTGSNASYRIHRLTFTRAKPFKVVDAALAEEVVKSNPNSFRIGTAEEVKHFYGSR